MKKGFLLMLCMILSLAIHAQSKPASPKDEGKKEEAKTEAGKEKKEAKAEAANKKEGKAAVKSVPAAKSQHAKPSRIQNKRRDNARPPMNRPARNPRPAVRVVKPGRGR